MLHLAGNRCWARETCAAWAMRRHAAHDFSGWGSAAWCRMGAAWVMLHLFPLQIMELRARAAYAARFSPSQLLQHAALELFLRSIYLFDIYLRRKNKKAGNRAAHAALRLKPLWDGPSDRSMTCAAPMRHHAAVSDHYHLQPTVYGIFHI